MILLLQLLVLNELCAQKRLILREICSIHASLSNTYRYMCSSILQRAMLAPIVWILVTLLDGKCFVCAFSNSIDPDKFSGFANITPSQVQLLLSKVPCKDDELMRNNTSRKAVSRYLRCWSQVYKGLLCNQSLSVEQVGLLLYSWDLSIRCKKHSSDPLVSILATCNICGLS